MKSNTNIDQILKELEIISENESYETMRERILSTLIFSTDRPEFKDQIRSLLDSGKLIPGTPILLNAERNSQAALSSCAVPPSEAYESLEKMKYFSRLYQADGMGTGWNFSDTNNVITQLEALNNFAKEEQESLPYKNNNRVAKMVILDIDHPEIHPFISFKKDRPDEDFFFNASVNVSNSFIQMAQEGKELILKNNTIVCSNELMQKIVENVHQNGDPGLFFFERLQKRNPLPHLGRYHSVAPCGEVGMTSGETCQFTYINVSQFIKNDDIDWDDLEKTIWAAIYFLDNALEISIQNYQHSTSAYIMSQKRKVGLGIMGWGDLLIALHIPYESQKALVLAESLMAFINFHSKKASVQLAKERQPLLAWHHPKNVYLQKGYLVHMFGKNTTHIQRKDWIKLEKEIQTYGLRNITTTALPPTGRSARIANASPQIEPLFSFKDHIQIKNLLQKRLQETFHPKTDIICDYFENHHTIQNCDDVPQSIKDVYVTALDISPKWHLYHVAAFQKFIDESISKTVNIAKSSTPDDIRKIYELADKLELIGITVYRNESRLQPIFLQDE